ncbi:hypothetical protein [Streptomyces ferrugineus]|nr:hypothetical protein [Streptomyces ferrugineus]
MGLDPARALGALRLSLGRWTTAAGIETAATALTRAIEWLVSPRGSP